MGGRSTHDLALPPPVSCVSHPVSLCVCGLRHEDRSHPTSRVLHLWGIPCASLWMLDAHNLTGSWLLSGAERPSSKGVERGTGSQGTHHAMNLREVGLGAAPGSPSPIRWSRLSGLNNSTFVRRVCLGQLTLGSFLSQR